LDEYSGDLISIIIFSQKKGFPLQSGLFIFV